MDKEEQPLLDGPSQREGLHERSRTGRLRDALRFAAAGFVHFAVWLLLIGYVKYTWLSSSSDQLPGNCGLRRHTLLSESFPLETGSHRDVAVIQSIEPKHDHDHGHFHGHHLHVRGRVDVRDGPEARIALDIAANDKDIPFDVSFDDNQKLNITTPPVLTWHEPYEPCLDVDVVVYLPKDSRLNLLYLHALTLDILLDSGLGLGLGHADLGTVSGDVRVRDGSLAEGTVGLTSVSGCVEAEVPVSEVIHVETTSGDISLKLVPVPDPPFSRSSLSVSSVSGKTNVTAKDMPTDVSYEDNVKTVSSDINLMLPFSSAAVRSSSGDITASLTPILAEGGFLKTKSLSGDVEVTVNEPADGRRLDSLTSHHDSTSGDQTIQYPASWEGKFRASAFSGHVSVKGKGVKVGGVRRGVKGGKGDGESRLKAKSFSGDIEVVIGEE